MSERIYRLLQGSYLLAVLYFELDLLVYILIGVLVFEALTNWRAPIWVSRIRYGKDILIDPYGDWCKFDFASERMMRFTMAAMLAFTFIVIPDLAWFFPWFIGAMLLSAGITNICPMVMFYRYFGFR